VELVIQVTPELGEQLAAPGPDAGAAAQAILDRLEQDGVALAAQPTGADQSGPPEFFSAEVADAATGEEIAKDLQAMEGVVSAYVKPDVAPPGGA
jgi:hypothetical protein